MAKGTRGARTHVGESVAGMAAHVGIPAVGIGHATLDAHEVHVLGLDDDLAMVVLGLLGKVGRQAGHGQHVGLAVGGIARAVQGQVHRSVMAHLYGVGMGFGVVVGRGRGIGLHALGHLIRGLVGHTGHHNLVHHQFGGVVAVVVQVEVNVVGTLANQAAAQFAVGELQAFAGVVEQGDVGPRRGLRVQIGVGGVGNELVLQTRHIQVALAYLGILVVEVGHFLFQA